MALGYSGSSAQTKSTGTSTSTSSSGRTYGSSGGSFSNVVSSTNGSSGNSAIGNTTALNAAKTGSTASVSKPSKGGTTTTTSSSGQEYGSHGGSFGGATTTGSTSSGSGNSSSASSGSSGSSSSGSHYDPNYGLGENGMPVDGSGGGGGGGGGGSSTPAQSETAADTSEIYDLTTNQPKPYEIPDLPEANPERLEHIDTKDMEDILQQITDSQKQQSQNSIDYNVQQGINNLNRAMEDAAQQYQTERDQVSADEATALDNQALYAEARGDRGGIGQAQYASIQNTAAQNQLAVNQAQTQLATDTARQVEDLRAQGEFQKADELLSITQSYLSQLMSLKQWATETNLSVDEFNSKLQQWVDEFKMSAQQYLINTELSAAGITGMFSDGTRTQAAQNELINALATSGNALLQAGIMPTVQQLNAMGMTEAQAQLYLAKKGF